MIRCETAWLDRMKGAYSVQTLDILNVLLDSKPELPW